MNCDRCHRRISKLRLAALPDVTTCVRCSTAQRYAADIITDPAEHTPTRVIPIRNQIETHAAPMSGGKCCWGVAID